MKRKKKEIEDINDENCNNKIKTNNEFLNIENNILDLNVERFNKDNKRINNIETNLKKIGKNIKIITLKKLFNFYIFENKDDELYMQLPCGHIFHSNCLKKWFGMKKECPICRLSVEEYI